MDTKPKTLSINEYFDKIFILNLKRRPDRKAKMIEKITKVGITNYEFVEAVDGLEEPCISYYRYKSQFNGFFEPPGAMGILLTILKIITVSKNRGYGKILILEDDAIFHKNFNMIFSEKQKHIPEWKLLYFGTSMHNWRLKERNHRINSAGFFNSEGEITGCFGLGINSSVFDELIFLIKNTNKALDTGPMKIINAKYQKQVVIFNPYLIICETDDSNLRESVSLKETARLCNWNLTDFL
jgi:GR25 family glycosyltransferase involved in LPS biosynthesis